MRFLTGTSSGEQHSVVDRVSYLAGRTCAFNITERYNKNCNMVRGKGEGVGDNHVASLHVEEFVHHFIEQYVLTAF